MRGLFSATWKRVWSQQSSSSTTSSTVASEQKQQPSSEPDFESLLPDPDIEPQEVSNWFLDSTVVENDGHHSSLLISESLIMEDQDNDIVEYFPFASQLMDRLPPINSITTNWKSTCTTTSATDCEISCFDRVLNILYDKEGNLVLKFDIVKALFDKIKIPLPQFITMLKGRKLDVVPNKVPRSRMVRPPPNIEWNIPLGANVLDLAQNQLVSWCFAFAEGFIDKCIEKVPSPKLRGWLQTGRDSIIIGVTIVSVFAMIFSLVTAATVSWEAFLLVALTYLANFIISLFTWKGIRDLGYLCAEKLFCTFDYVKNKSSDWIFNISNLFQSNNLPNSNPPPISTPISTPNTPNTQPVAIVQPPPQKTLSEVMKDLKMRCSSIQLHSLTHRELNHIEHDHCRSESENFLNGDECCMCGQIKPLCIGVHATDKIVLCCCRDCFTTRENNDIVTSITSMGVDTNSIDFFLLKSNTLCMKGTCYSYGKCSLPICSKYANLFLVNSEEKTVRIGRYCPEHILYDMKEEEFIIPTITRSNKVIDISCEYHNDANDIERKELSLPIPCKFSTLVSVWNNSNGVNEGVENDDSAFWFMYKNEQGGSTTTIVDSDVSMVGMISCFLRVLYTDKRVLIVKPKFPFLTELTLNSEKKGRKLFESDHLQSFQRFKKRCLIHLGREDTLELNCFYSFNQSRCQVEDDTSFLTMIKNLSTLDEINQQRQVDLTTQILPLKRVTELYKKKDARVSTITDRGGQAHIFLVTPSSDTTDTTAGTSSGSGNEAFVVRAVVRQEENEALKEIIVARQDSPHLVRYESVEIHDGIVYYTMEYFKHGTLAQLQPNQITNEMILSLLKQILKAVELLHNQDKIHCDIKPSNIFVRVLKLEESIIEIALGDFGDVLSIKDLAAKTKWRGTKVFGSGTKKNSKHEDLFNVASTLFNIVTGKYAKECSKEVKVSLLKGENVSEKLIDLLCNIFENYQTLTVQELLEIVEQITL